jgi:hypothetical protein
MEKGLDRTSDLSSSGLHFSAARALEPGLSLDLVINWPLRQNEGVQLHRFRRGRLEQRKRYCIVGSSGTSSARGV